MMTELSGRGGYWSPKSWTSNVEVGSDPQDEESVRLRLVVVHRMMKLSGRIGSGPRMIELSSRGW